MQSEINQNSKPFDEYSIIPIIGKTPLEPNWQKYCHTKNGPWEPDYASCDVGICCGPASGLLVLDVDDVDAFDHLAKANGFDVAGNIHRQNRRWRFAPLFPVSSRWRTIRMPVFETPGLPKPHHY